MTKYILGKELLDQWKIKPFELFRYVRDGLQPHNKYDKPKSPPHIDLKLNQLSDLKKELSLPNFSWLRLSVKKRKSLAKKYRGKCGYVTSESPFFQAILGPSLESERWIPRYRQITKDIKILKNELAKIKNKYSWGDYELPEDTSQAEWVINSLLSAYYKRIDVDKIEKEEAKQSEKNSPPAEKVLSSETQISGSMKDMGAENERGFKHSPDFRTVRKDGKKFELTSKQAQVIQMLWEAYKDGLPGLGKDRILEDVSGGSRLRDIFKSNPKAFKALIKQGERRRGICRLNI